MPASGGTELPSLLAVVRALTQDCRAADRRCLVAWRDLAALLLTRTVLAEGVAPRLYAFGASRDRGSLGGVTRIGAPLRLRDRGYLRLSMAMEIRHGRFLVAESSYQYQHDEDDRRWVFRYDYRRNPNDPYPGAHLQVRGALEEPTADGRALERVHFPTGRVSLESVIRLLVEEFRVPCGLPLEVWRPLLEESERLFHEHATRPRTISGP